MEQHWLWQVLINWMTSISLTCQVLFFTVAATFCWNQSLISWSFCLKLLRQKVDGCWPITRAQTSTICLASLEENVKLSVISRSYMLQCCVKDNHVKFSPFWKCCVKYYDIFGKFIIFLQDKITAMSSMTSFCMYCKNEPTEYCKLDTLRKYSVSVCNE